jgi:hypothetical protein
VRKIDSGIGDGIDIESHGSRQVLSDKLNLWGAGFVHVPRTIQELDHIRTFSPQRKRLQPRLAVLCNAMQSNEN